MPKTKTLFDQAFSFDDLLDDVYEIEVTPQERKCIFLSSKSTAQKLASSSQFVELDDNKFGFKLVKKHSLLVGESQYAQQKISNDGLALMYELTAELMESGIDEAEVKTIITNPNQYSKLTDEQKKKAYKFLASALTNQSLDLKILTVMLKARIHSSWTHDDTENLPQSLVEKFIAFYEGEKNQWVENEEEESPKEQ